MYINANHLIKKNNNNEPLLYETLKYLSKEDFNKINNCEIIQCKHCGNNDSDYYRKSGIVHGKQRYYCKKCKKHFSIKSNQFFLDLIKSYAIYMHINNPDTLNTIDYLCTDSHHAYDKIANHYLYRNNIKKHIISKKKQAM